MALAHDQHQNQIQKLHVYAKVLYFLIYRHNKCYWNWEKHFYQIAMLFHVCKTADQHLSCTWILLQASRSDLTSTVQRITTFLDLLVPTWMFLVFVAGAHCRLMPSFPSTSVSPSLSQLCCSKAPAYNTVGVPSFASGRFGIYPCWISGGSCWPVCPASYTLLNGCYQVVLPLRCHLQTWWGCIP